MSKNPKEIESRLGARLETKIPFDLGDFNAFTFPLMPVVSSENPSLIQFYHWGLVPSWAKDMSIRKHTLNARIETIHEKPSFRAYVRNRCIIPAEAFYEFQWLDSKGKQKRKFKLHFDHLPLFTFAGLWSTWTNPETAELIHSFTILTKEATGLMAEIHNSKKRMPLILDPESEQAWPAGAPAEEVSLINHLLKATPVEENNTGLFGQ